MNWYALLWILAVAALGAGWGLLMARKYYWTCVGLHAVSALAFLVIVVVS